MCDRILMTGITRPVRHEVRRIKINSKLGARGPMFCKLETLICLVDFLDNFIFHFTPQLIVNGFEKSCRISFLQRPNFIVGHERTHVISEADNSNYKMLSNYSQL